MKRFFCVILLAPLIATAAPSKKDKEEVSKIVDRSGTILGGLIECDLPQMRDSYLESLRDALSAYPGTDPVKVRIPRPSGHLFHEHPATDSTVIRPPVPRSSGHP